jgi:hypothetical protein
MGLREIVQGAVQQGLLATDNTQQDLTYKAAGTPSYTPASGAVSVTLGSQTVKGIICRWQKHELDGDTIRPTDQKCLIGGTLLSATPTLNDQIIDSAGVTWVVQGAQLDPMGALWIINLRRPG